MTFEELQANKVANDGENAQGQLSAEEYNTLLERVQDLSQPGHGEPRVKPGQTGGMVDIYVTDGVINITTDNANVVVPQRALRAYIHNPSIDLSSDDWTSFDFIPRPISVVLWLSTSSTDLRNNGNISVLFVGAGEAQYSVNARLYIPCRITEAYFATGTVIITLYPLPGRQVAFTVSQAYN